jgi:hypothetical protein
MEATMNVAERLAMAVRSRPSGGRPDTEAFLARVLPALGVAHWPDVAKEAGPAGAGPRQNDSDEDEVQEAFTPPTRGELLDELHGLVPAAEREDGSATRRIAEIIEVIDGEDAACVWWLHAAQAGDEVALAIVEDLDLNNTYNGERPSVLRSTKQLKRHKDW